MTFFGCEGDYAGMGYNVMHQANNRSWCHNTVFESESVESKTPKARDAIIASVARYFINIIIIIIYPRYQGSRAIWKKIEIRNCRSDHYSRQSSEEEEEEESAMI